MSIFTFSNIFRTSIAIVCTAGWGFAASPTASEPKVSFEHQEKEGPEADALSDPKQKEALAKNQFALELAGIAFQENKFSVAKMYLNQALSRDPRDVYTNNFLATIYFLEENLNAALKYWNRVSKPEIKEIQINPPAALPPALLDRALAGSSGSRLKLDDFLEMQAVMQSLDVFTHLRFELSPRPDEKFDLVLRTVQRNSWRSNKLSSLFSFLRGLPYQTVYPEFYNLNGSASHLLSLARWDAHKRRFLTSFSSPIGDHPKWRYRVYLDGRSENWAMSKSFQERARGEFKMKKTEAGVEIQSIVNGRWAWKTGFHLAHRAFAQTADRNPNSVAARFADGLSLKYRADLDHRLLQIPERRLSVKSSAGLELGKAWAGSRGSFSKTEASVRALWLPQAKGNDYQVAAQFRSGKTNGHVPFDELFVLGVERDTNLWLRGHKGTRQGRKGNALLGTSYLLFNGELDKRIYRHSFIELTAGPFLDTGKVYDGSPFGSTNWLWDTGFQGKLKILGGPTFNFSWGKDLRSGENALFATVSR